MDPREFQRLATQLAGGGGPAQMRTATSRAYYAVYNVGAIFLNQIVPLSKGAASHGQVQRLLANCKDADVIAVGNDLGALHSRRIDADYEMTDLNCENQKTVQATVVEAKDMIDVIDHAFTGSGSQSLKKTIQSYWTGILREPLKGRTPIP
jgi:hypothetical protein